MGHETPQHSSWRHISICVDDFGLHEGINEAVFALTRQGRVQAVSAMVGGRAWEEGARALRTLDPRRVEVGLHLDLTECPLQPALRTPLGRLIARAYLRRLDAADLRTEIRAQLDAFERAMGRAPAYVDGHQHVHQLPVVRTLLLQELARRYPAGGLWLRATHSPQGAAHADARTGFKSHVIAFLGARALSALARRQGLRQNARLLGVYDFTGGAQQYRARLGRWLRAARDGDLLMCHVGLPAQAPDVLARARQDEFAVIAAPDFETLLQGTRVRLRPMGQMLCQ
ncbi:YdjC family protein [Alicycliphilus sp. B1]|nr:YdjC family protein [Alicycliphilus denitrificans BC]GAO27306.1 YdjC family protein [Alicycliphilus sp. B1]